MEASVTFDGMVYIIRSCIMPQSLSNGIRMVWRLALRLMTWFILCHASRYRVQAMVYTPAEAYLTFDGMVYFMSCTRYTTVKLYDNGTHEYLD